MYRALILGLGLPSLTNNAVGGPWSCAGTRYDVGEDEQFERDARTS